MRRGAFEPTDFGINLERREFVDRLVDDFHGHFRGTITVDELLLNPREAMRFCEDVRTRRAWSSVPDDVLLRLLLQRRKNPA